MRKITAIYEVVLCYLSMLMWHIYFCYLYNWLMCCIIVSGHSQPAQLKCITMASTHERNHSYVYGSSVLFEHAHAVYLLLLVVQLIDVLHHCLRVLTTSTIKMHCPGINSWDKSQLCTRYFCAIWACSCGIFTFATCTTDWCAASLSECTHNQHN